MPPPQTRLLASFFGEHMGATMRNKNVGLSRSVMRLPVTGRRDLPRFLVVRLELIAGPDASRDHALPGVTTTGRTPTLVGS
jgi:hypothetical protein